MTAAVHIETVHRRHFILGTAATALITSLTSGASAQSTPPTSDDVIKAILKDAKPAEGKVTLDLPEIAENGNTVPFSVAVESPMTAGDYVKTVHIISTGNPLPDIGSYSFTPQAGKASVSSRMRLAKTQDIVAIAEMSDGKMFMTKRIVKVTIGGCGG